MQALVIGGTGFIGLSVVDALLAAGASVRITRRKQSATVLLRRRPVELVQASLQEPERLRDAMTGCDVVFLCGAYYPRYSLDLDGALAEGVAGVRCACEAALAAGVPRFVYTSTIATLARAQGGRPADERDVAWTRPHGSVYRAVKWEMECEVDRARRRGLSTVTLMPGGCMGPGDVRLGTGAVLVGVVRGALSWWVDGVVNLVDIEDVASPPRGRPPDAVRPVLSVGTRRRCGVVVAVHRRALRGTGSGAPARAGRCACAGRRGRAPRSPRPGKGAHPAGAGGPHHDRPACLQRPGMCGAGVRAPATGRLARPCPCVVRQALVPAAPGDVT
jgi:hypothetical protein